MDIRRAAVTDEWRKSCLSAVKSSLPPPLSLRFRVSLSLSRRGKQRMLKITCTAPQVGWRAGRLLGWMLLLLCGLQARAGLDAVESSTVFAPPIPLPYLISIEREAGPSCDVWPRRWAASQSSRAARRRRGGEEEGGEEAERSARQSPATAHWPQVDWTWRAPRRKSTRRNYYGPSKER